MPSARSGPRSTCVEAVGGLDPGADGRGLEARAGVLTGEAAVTLGATGPGDGRGRPRQHREPAAVRGAAGRRPRGRGDVPGGQPGDRVRGGGRAGAQGQGGSRSRVAGAARRGQARRRGPGGGPRGAVRRPRRRAAPAQGASSTPRRASVGLASCRSPVRRASARAGSPGSSRSTSTALVETVYWHQGRSPGVRRGHHVLGARRDGPAAAPAWPRATTSRRPARASRRRSRLTCPTRPNAGG